MTDFAAYSSPPVTSLTDDDICVAKRGGGGINFKIKLLARRDSNGNLSFGADAASPTLAQCYGYWAGFPSTSGSAPGLLYEPVDTDWHRVSLLNNAYPTGNGTFTDQMGYVRTGTSANRYFSDGGRHIFQAAAPGVAGQVITWKNQLYMTSPGFTGFGAIAGFIGGEGMAIDIASTFGIGVSIRNNNSTNATLALWSSPAGINNVLTAFFTDAGFQRGSISFNRGGGLIAYNTTSDYRAKDDLGAVEDAGDLIDALRPFMGRMRGAVDSRPMFMAHEVAEAGAPWCVTGDKDAVDEDGKPVFQQLDMTPLIPVLIAEIQSLRARVAALEMGA